MKTTRKYPALGVLFKGIMVKAIKAGRKTQTRRLDGLQQVNALHLDKLICDWPLSEFLGINAEGNAVFNLQNDVDSVQQVVCKPKYRVGEILYVKETWVPFVDEHVIDQRYAYRADASRDSEEFRQQYIKAGYPYQWKSSLLMPYKVARIFLKITGVRIERLNSISQADAIAEGIQGQPLGSLTSTKMCWANYTAPNEGHLLNPIDSYETLWESINGKDSWEANPYVWVYTFERTEKPATV